MAKYILLNPRLLLSRAEQRRLKLGYVLKQNRCIQCKESIPTRKKFCNDDCYNLWKKTQTKMRELAFRERIEEYNRDRRFYSPLWLREHYPDIIRKRKRSSRAFATWRTEVRKIQGNLCEICGKVGTIVHHIKSIKDFPKLAFNLDNGMVVCKQCHQKLHPELGTFILNSYSWSKQSASVGYLVTGW